MYTHYAEPFNFLKILNIFIGNWFVSDLFQSPNGVWNIFGGKLAWGPEAIVCDDPNFQGCGNPSTGMYLAFIGKLIQLIL